MKNFTDEQMQRYEVFRRSGGSKFRDYIRKVMASVCGYSVSDDTGIAMSGITKVLVGELVEEGVSPLSFRQ